MLAQMAELNSFGWEKIKAAIGIETLVSLYEQSDLFACLTGVK